jgi:manganese/zinc/iron transport system permease protein
MSTAQIEIIVLACLVAVTCVLPGVFLVLRRMSLMSDAISHAILLGIVVAFFYTKSLSSPFLLLGAALVGVLTVTLTEIVVKTRKLKEDAAIGLVFPVLFSLGVILLSRYASKVHLDTQCVLLGELAFAPFDRVFIGGKDLGPQGFWVMGTIFAINLAFIAAYYKELKLSTFDPDLAASLGFNPTLLHYALMTLVSVTCVGAFQTVGSILVVALMITPPAAAYLLTDRLSHMILYSAIIGIASAIGGYAMAHHFDTNIAGSMATMSGIIFILVLIFAPERGLLAKLVLRRWRKWDLGMQMLAVHLFQSEVTHAAYTENIIGHMKDHMLWEDAYTTEVIAQSLQEGTIKKDGERLILTPFGREKARNALSKD